MISRKQMFSTIIHVLPITILFLSKNIAAKGCEKEDDTWICTAINLETDKKLPISGLNSNVKSLKFEDCLIPVVPTGVFNSFRNVLDIDLEKNQIASIAPGSLDEQKQLSKLHLRNNKLTEIKLGVFNSLFNVKELNLHYNQISKLEDYCFTNMTHLELLRLGWNKLKYISANVFVGLKGLKHLFLNNNLLTRLSAGSFRNLPSFYQLDAEHNYVSQMEFGAISKADGLSILALSFNNLSKIDEDFLFGFNSLHTLHISNNRISAINVQKIFSYCPNLQKISLNNNSWLCNSLIYNIQIFRIHNITIIDNNTELVTNFHGIKCSPFAEETTTERANILENLEERLGEKFLNINILKNINQNILNSTIDYIDSMFRNYFEIGFKNTTFYNYFHQDFKNSSFYKHFDQYFSELLEKIQNSTTSLENDDLSSKNITDTNVLQYFQNGIFVSVCMFIVIIILLISMCLLCYICIKKKRSLSFRDDALL